MAYRAHSSIPARPIQGETTKRLLLVGGKLGNSFRNGKKCSAHGAELQGLDFPGDVIQVCFCQYPPTGIPRNPFHIEPYRAQARTFPKKRGG